jgi:hypothetical protein
LGDQRFAGEITLEAAELFGGNNHHLVAPVHGDVLRPLAANAAHQLAESRLGVLQQPASGFQVAGAAGLGGLGRGFHNSSHAD